MLPIGLLEMPANSKSKTFYSHRHSNYCMSSPPAAYWGKSIVCPSKPTFVVVMMFTPYFLLASFYPWRSGDSLRFLLSTRKVTLLFWSFGRFSVHASKNNCELLKFARVLMGMGEAGYYAGMIYYLSFWYGTESEYFLQQPDFLTIFTGIRGENGPPDDHDTLI